MKNSQPHWLRAVYSIRFFECGQLQASTAHESECVPKLDMLVLQFIGDAPAHSRRGCR